MASDTSKNIGVYADAVDNRGYASHVNAKDMALLTNKSGGSVTTGDVLVQDTSTNLGFTTSTTDKDQRPVFVVPAAISGDNVSATKTIANNEAGWVYKNGAYVPSLAVSAAVSRGEYLKVGTTAKKLTGTGKIAGTNDRPAEAVAIALEAAAGAGTVAALLLTQNAVKASTAVFADHKAQNTGGGNFASGAWRVRDLNTEVSDADSIVTIASNLFKPIAGTYFIIARAPCFHDQLTQHQARLINSTQSSAVVLTGSSAHFYATTGGNQSDAWVAGVFTANGTDEYAIDHRCVPAANTPTFGKAANLTTEVYTQVTLIKIA